MNLKELNNFLIAPHFKLEDARTVARLISPGAYLASLDLKDAYYLVPVDPSHWKFLRFQFLGKLYEFTCLPFGLCTAPFTFTKLLKPVMHILQSEGFFSVVYLDDFLLVGKSILDCERNVAFTCKLLAALGFLFSERKCHFPPTRQCQYLGLLFDSARFSVEIPQKRRLAVLKLVKKFCKLKVCSIRSFARFLGSLGACCPALPYAWVYTKKFEREKVLALDRSGGDYDALMTIPSCTEDFDWWKSNLVSGWKSLHPVSFQMEIFSDASLTGWGASCGEQVSHGFWTGGDLDLHINVLELKAALLALKAFARVSAGSHVLLRVDNTTAISYINKMGGILSPTLNQAARELWQWCESRRISVFASYIPSAENWRADRESRRINPDTELELSELAFLRVCHRFGRPSIDLFASQSNFKCPTYFSWFPDPDAAGVDAFTFCWTGTFFYAFPPFSLILRVLQKIDCDGAEGILIVPLWTTQSWFPLFLSMLVEEPVHLFIDEIIFYSSQQRTQHLPSLVAGRVSSWHSGTRRSQNQLGQSAWRQHNSLR